MRLISAIKSDILFQYKQGFYLIYIVITITYMLALSWLPTSILNYGVPLVVFSDPSVLGLFFIGGIIMLEKLQGVISAIVVTPLKTEEYIASKVLSLALVSVMAGLSITLVTYEGSVNWIILILALLLTASFFTLCGFIVVAKCQTVNQYLMKMVPIMTLVVIPCFSLIGFKYAELFTIFPSVAALRLLLSAYFPTHIFEVIGLVVYLCLANYVTMKYVKKIFEKHVVYGG